MKTLYIILGVAAVGAVGAFMLRRRQNEPIRNDAAGPRLPGMPSMPTMPSMPKMPGMPDAWISGSGAVPNAPRIGPQAPDGMFSGMWH